MKKKSIPPMLVCSGVTFENSAELPQVYLYVQHSVHLLSAINYDTPQITMLIIKQKCVKRSCPQESSAIAVHMWLMHTENVLEEVVHKIAVSLPYTCG